MGGSTAAYTNVMDSGNEANDSMKVLGTLDDDNILIRSSDMGLGMIGLMPEDNSKSAVERVNYWFTGEKRGVENISVETGFGNDTVTVSSTLSSMSIDAGVGDDKINIGQLYKSGAPSINELDSFKESLLRTSEGLLDSGNTHALFVDGGAGKDIFEILHTNSALSLHGGGLDGATYNIRSFIDETGGFIVNKGIVSLAGRGVRDPRLTKPFSDTKGATILNYYATTLNDDIIYACESMLTSCYEIQTLGIDFFNCYGGEGTNHYYMMGGESIFEQLFNINMDLGENILYVGDELTESQYRTQIEKLRKNRAKTIELITDGLNTIPIIREGESFEYGIKLSQKPQGTVSVKISVPLTSDVEMKNGNSGLLLVDENGNYCSSIVKEFDSSNYNTLQKIKIVYVGDQYTDDNDVAFLLQDIETTSSADKIDCMMNIPVLLSDESSGNLMSTNYPKCDKLGFDVVDSCIVLCDKPEIDLTKLSLASLRFVNESGKVCYISTSKTSDCDYWYKVERDKIYIYSALTDELVPITGRLDFVNMLKGSMSYEQDECFLLNSSTFQFEYDCSTSPALMVLVVGEDVGYLSTFGYYVENSGNQFVIYSGETGLPVEVTGFLYSYIYLGVKDVSLEFGGSLSERVYENGLSFTRVGDSRSYEVIGNARRIELADKDLHVKMGLQYSKLASTPQAAPIPPVTPTVASSDAAEYSAEVVLEEGLPGFVSVGEGETVRIKIPASMSTSSNIALMVNSEDGKSLPALTWSWDDTNKKRNSITEEMDLSYQVNISDAVNEDDFIYVYLHAAKACQFVASALVS